MDIEDSSIDLWGSCRKGGAHEISTQLKREILSKSGRHRARIFSYGPEAVVGEEDSQKVKTADGRCCCRMVKRCSRQLVKRLAVTTPQLTFMRPGVVRSLQLRAYGLLMLIGRVSSLAANDW